MEILLSDLGTSETIDILLAEMVTVSEVLQQVGKVIEMLPDLIVSERTTLLETIRNERLETLTFMSGERNVVLEALQNERKIFLESLGNERRAIINDIKIIENDIIQNAIKSLDKSIDHFLWHSAQLIGACIIFLFIVGFVSVFIIIKYRPGSEGIFHGKHRIP